MKNIFKSLAISSYAALIQKWLFSQDQSLTESSKQLCERAYKLGLRPVERPLAPGVMSRWRRAESKVPLWAMAIIIPDLIIQGWRPASKSEWAAVAHGLLAQRLHSLEHDLNTTLWQKTYHLNALSIIKEIVESHPELHSETLEGWAICVALEAEYTLRARSERLSGSKEEEF